MDNAIAREALQIVRAMKEYRALPYSERRKHYGDYCVHGTYIGSWWGPDYLCGPCEDGVSDYEYALGMAYAEAERRARVARETYFRDVLVPLVGRVYETPAYQCLSDVEKKAVMDAFICIARI